MDRRSLLAGAGALGVLAALPSSGAEAATTLRRPVYSNMAEAEALSRARTLLRGAGISPARVGVFTRHVH